MSKTFSLVVRAGPEINGQGSQKALLFKPHQISNYKWLYPVTVTVNFPIMITFLK